MGKNSARVIANTGKCFITGMGNISDRVTVNMEPFFITSTVSMSDLDKASIPQYC